MQHSCKMSLAEQSATGIHQPQAITATQGITVFHEARAMDAVAGQPPLPFTLALARKLDSRKGTALASALYMLMQVSAGHVKGGSASLPAMAHRSSTVATWSRSHHDRNCGRISVLFRCLSTPTAHFCHT
jgi:hypothetical protein